MFVITHCRSPTLSPQQTIGKHPEGQVFRGLAVADEEDSCAFHVCNRVGLDAELECLEKGVMIFNGLYHGLKRVCLRSSVRNSRECVGGWPGMACDGMWQGREGNEGRGGREDG